MAATTDKITAYRALHTSGCFVLPNPWDVGSARYLQQLGFKAVASTSAGFAWSQGLRDTHVPRDVMLDHLRAISAAIDIPVNADFEGGFAVEPAEVAGNVTLCVATGVSGLSIEDSTGNAEHPLFPFDLAVERIKAARAAIDATKSGVVLTARTEGYLWGRPDRAETIRRLQAFAAAGADCLYAPGLKTKEDMAAIIAAVAPKPVNINIGRTDFSAAEIAATGARRISVGGSLAATAWGEFMRAAKEIAEAGTFSAFSRAPTGQEINKLFG
jgi:methylisocitrate lyase